MFVNLFRVLSTFMSRCVIYVVKIRLLCTHYVSNSSSWHRYGDRIPLTYSGRLLTIIWMLSGTVLFTLLVSYISSGLTIASLDSNIKLYGCKVSARFYGSFLRLVFSPTTIKQLTPWAVVFRLSSEGHKGSSFSQQFMKSREDENSGLKDAESSLNPLDNF